MKKLLFLTMVMVNCVVGATLASVAGVAPAYGAIGVNALGSLGNITGATSSLRASLPVELYVNHWTGEILRAFRNNEETLGWWSRIPSYDHLVNKNIIYFVELGEDPDILVNNTDYPLPIKMLMDEPIHKKLDKFQTEVTYIQDDILRALSYNKLPEDIERHKQGLQNKKYKKGLWGMAPDENTLTTPVLVTTGDLTADGRRRMTESDINTLKMKFDMLKIPFDNRILVLNPEHVRDLLDQDRSLSVQYNNRVAGKITNLSGFDIYEFVDSPYYNATTRQKLPYDSIPTTGDMPASVAFYVRRGFRAGGDFNLYFAPANTNPRYQQSEFGIRQYFKTEAMTQNALGAIISAAA